jgi:hypothetical protein
MPSIRTGAIGDGLIQHGPRRSDGQARRRVCLPKGPCHNYRIRRIRFPDPSPREGALGIGRRRRRNDRGRFDSSSPRDASVG